MARISRAEWQWRRIVPPKECRATFLGSTGTGKSTLEAALLEHYRLFYPAHPIILADPKRRFFPVHDPHSRALFPRGYHRQNFGRRDGVHINARRVEKPVKLRPGSTVVVQDVRAMLEWCNWLYHNADVRLPTLLVFDEALQFQRGNQVLFPLRRLIQEGRELGIGIWVVHQRPRRLDTRHISESERLYIGNLYHEDDRKYLMKEAATDLSRWLAKPFPPYTFMMANQAHPDQSVFIRLPGPKGGKKR